MMARRVSVILLFALSLGCSSREADVQQFIAARDLHQRNWDSLWRLMEPGSTGQASLDSVLKFNSDWVREHEPQLRRIVGSLQMAGLTDSAKMLIGVQSGPYDNTNAPDGFLYRTTDSVNVFVSDTAIVRRWLGAMDTSTMYVGMFLVEAAPERCFRLSPTSPTKHVLNAMAIEDAQDRLPDGCQADAVAVSILVGHRVIAAQRYIQPTADSGRLAAIAQALVDRLPDR